MSDLHELESLELSPYDEKGKVKATRLKDAKSALSIYNTLLKADEASAVNRARIDGMFDGAAPYNSAHLAASNQTLKTNLNFGEAQRLLDISLSAYVDLYSSLERFVEVKTKGQDDPSRHQKEEVIADEFTRMLRNWPEFHSLYLRLCTIFLKHGVGTAYFDSPDDWKFRVGGFADILIPRQSPATEESLDVVVIRREYHLHELARFIKNEKAATAVGWNVKEMKRVMKKHVSTSGRRGGSSTFLDDFEALQAEVKNNDIYIGIQNPTVSILQFLVRELDGSISSFMTAHKDAEDFIYKKVGKYKNAEEAYVFFANGVGSNGTYHSIRGLGQRIFAHIQTSNRLRCQQIDGAMMSSAVMLQPENNRALDELEFSYYGPYAVMSPNVKIIEKAIPNLGTAVQPALQDLQQQLALNTDTVSPYGPERSSPYKNQMQVVADMDVATRLSGAALNLFYNSWNRLLRQVFRRLIESKKRDDLTKEFFTRCEARGVGNDFIKTLDLGRTRAVRSIGNGSMANRLVALREIQAMSGGFDEIGQRNLRRDIVATRAGLDLADRYVPNTDEPRVGVDTKIAMLENDSLMAGKPVAVISSELHGEHLRAHLPLAEQIIEGYNSGQADPMQMMPIIQAVYQHLAQTAGFAGADANLKGLVGQVKQILNYLEEILNNTQKSIEAQQRKMQEEQAQAQAQGQAQQPAGPPEVDLKMQAHQVDQQIKMEKAQLELDIKNRKFEQEQAHRDAKAALEFREDAVGSGGIGGPTS